MLFSENFIEKIEADPVSGILEACDLSDIKVEEATTTRQYWNEQQHEILWEAASFLNLVIEQEQFSFSNSFPEATSDIEVNCKNVTVYINKIRDYFGEKSVHLKVESYRNRYSTSFKSSFAYEFSQGDLERVQELVTELRSEISKLVDLDQGHKQRLLGRLEKLQSELHKRVSDLDRFWGLIGDAGVVLGKLGKNAKPIVDRTREIAEIIWKTQARTEELPSDVENPMIGSDKNS